MITRALKSQGTEIEDLPNEMIYELLKYIPKKEHKTLRKVNHLFNSIIKWYFGLHLEISDTNYIGILRQRGIKNLNVSKLTKLIPWSCCQSKWTISKLDFNGIVRLDNIIRMLLLCPNLNEFILSQPILINILKPDIEFTDRHSLPKNLKRIELKLDMFYGHNFWNFELFILKILCQLPLNKLETLRIFKTEKREGPFEDLETGNEFDEIINKIQRCLTWFRMELTRGVIQEDPKESIFTILKKSKFSIKNLSVESIPVFFNESESEYKELFSPIILDTLSCNLTRTVLTTWPYLLQEQNKLTKLNLLCDTDFWVSGIVEEAVIKCKNTLKSLKIIVESIDHLLIGPPIDISFINEVKELEEFYFYAPNSFKTMTDLPPSIKILGLDGPLFSECIYSFYPKMINLEKFILSRFLSVNVPIEDEEVETDEILVTFNFNMEMLRTFIRCAVDLEEILEVCQNIVGLTLCCIESGLDGPPSHFSPFLSRSFKIAINSDIFRRPNI